MPREGVGFGDVREVHYFLVGWGLCMRLVLGMNSTSFQVADVRGIEWIILKVLRG